VNKFTVNTLPYARYEFLIKLMGDLRNRKKCPEIGQAFPMTGGASFRAGVEKRRVTRRKTRTATDKPVVWVGREEGRVSDGTCRPDGGEKRKLERVRRRQRAWRKHGARVPLLLCPLPLNGGDCRWYK